MKKIVVILSACIFLLSCGKETEFQSGFYSAEFYSQHGVTVNKDPKIKIEKLPDGSLRLQDFITIQPEGNRIRADIACCTSAFYSAYELEIDGTFYTKKGISTMQGFYTAVGQAGPFAGTFKLHTACKAVDL